MASISARKRVRYTFDVHFGTTEDKERLVERLKHVRQLLSQAGNPCTDNHSFMCALFDAVETGFLSRPLTQPRMRILSLSFETVVWIISIRCVLELTYGKSSILIFFQASTWRKLPLMTTTPCSSVNDTASWIF